MSEKKSIFETKDFKDICFYYFLHFFNYTKKIEIGEKINQFNGVSNYGLLFLFYFIDNQFYFKR